MACLGFLKQIQSPSPNYTLSYLLIRPGLVHRPILFLLTYVVVKRRSRSSYVLTWMALGSRCGPSPDSRLFPSLPHSQRNGRMDPTRFSASRLAEEDCAQTNVTTMVSWETRPWTCFKFLIHLMAQFSRLAYHRTLSSLACRTGL